MIRPLFISCSIPRLGDYARDIGDQLMAQASMAVQHMVPQTSRSRARQSMGNPEELEKPENEKRTGMKVPSGRETEGDEKEIEVFDPETVEKPQRPNSGEENWFRPLVPFSFSFGLLTPWWEG